MKGQSPSVRAYLESLPSDRRAVIEAVRDAVNRALPKGYEEGIQYNMIGWFVPHSIYPAGYHCNPKEPLPFVSLANQKNHMALYLFCLYMDPVEIARFQQRWTAGGKKLDMGKSCVRFKHLEDVNLDAIGEAIGRIPVAKFVAQYDAMYSAAQARNRAKKAASKAETKKAPAKKAPVTSPPSEKAASKKGASKKAPAKKPATKKQGAKKSSTKKAITKKAGAKKAPSKKRG